MWSKREKLRCGTCLLRALRKTFSVVAWFFGRMVAEKAQQGTSLPSPKCATPTRDEIGPSYCERAAGANVNSGSGNNSNNQPRSSRFLPDGSGDRKPTRTVPWWCIFMIRVGGHNARRAPVPHPWVAPLKRRSDLSYKEAKWGREVPQKAESKLT